MTPTDSQFLAALERRLGMKYRYVGPLFRAAFSRPMLKRAGGLAALKQYVVHHADGRITLRRAWEYHIQTKKWTTGGYGIGVFPDGRVEVAAVPSELTFGALNHNTDSYHVCVLDDCQTNEPTADSLNALYHVLCTLDDVVGNKRWRGHVEAMQPEHPNYTSCPGQHLLPHVVTMRGVQYGAGNPRALNYP